MDLRKLAREHRRFDPELALERASTPPSSWYTDPDFLELERRSVLRRSWQPLARLDRLARPGSYVTGDWGGEPWVVLRDERGELRAFANVCKHHAACILKGEGSVRELVCPYHGWTYDLQGRLRSAPRLGRVEDFDREAHGLDPLEVETWGPLVFARLARGGVDLERVLGPLDGRLPRDSLRFAARRSYELRCNWKVFVDNYLDGGYHVPHMHPGLAGQLDLESYTTELHEWLSLQLCGSGDGDGAGRDFVERVAGGAVYAFVYPNLMLNRYGPILDTNWVVPLGPNRTLTVFDYYFEADVLTRDPEFVARSLEASDRVQQEDVAVCESVQRGLCSSAFDRGRYAPDLEHGAHHFHRLLAAELGEALREPR